MGRAPALGDNRRARWRAKQDIAIVHLKEWASRNASNVATGRLCEADVEMYRVVRALEKSEGML